MTEKVYYVQPGKLKLPEVLDTNAFPEIWKALGMKPEQYPELLPDPEKHMTLGEARRRGLLDKEGKPVSPETVDWRWDPEEGRIVSQNFGEVGVLCVVKQNAAGNDFVAHTSHYINEGPELLNGSGQPIQLEKMAGVSKRSPSLSVATVEFVGEIPYLHVRFQWRTFMQAYAVTLAGGYWKKGLTWEEAIAAEVQDELGGRIVKLINNPQDESEAPKIWLNRARNVDEILIPVVVVERMDEFPPFESPEEDEVFAKIRLAIPLMDLQYTQLPDNYCQAAIQHAINLHVRGKLK